MTPDSEWRNTFRPLVFTMSFRYWTAMNRLFNVSSNYASAGDKLIVFVNVILFFPSAYFMYAESRPLAVTSCSSMKLRMPFMLHYFNW